MYFPNDALLDKCIEEVERLEKSWAHEYETSSLRYDVSFYQFAVMMGLSQRMIDIRQALHDRIVYDLKH